MKKMNKILPVLLICFSTIWVNQVSAQVEHKWLGLGSLHNFYANFGTEIEHSFVARQQYGLVWPGIFEFQDAQAAKGMWLGATNFTDENGTNFPIKVVHSGPRVRGAAFFFPVEFKLVSKVPATDVIVDGNSSFRLEQTVDEVDPTIPGDRMMYAKFNTALGLTVERKIHQFSQVYHDNYHVFEIKLTNTGFINNEDVQRINAPLTGLVFYEQVRWAPVLQTRYTIGNATGWGINTMNDRTGDGLENPALDPGSTDEFKSQFAWHGRLSGFAAPIPGAIDNVGAPIIVPSTVNGYLSAADTSGRLGAYHFVGKVHIHADTSPSDPTNDPNQPMTMDEIGSDDPMNSQNDPFNGTKMSAEYNKMIAGRLPRHAYSVEDKGYEGFVKPGFDPSRGTSGGWSAATGYGPYTLAPGESITIVYAEAVSGIGHAFAREVGSEYKANIKSGMDADVARRTKNVKMFQGRDSLFQTFRRAIANYNSGYALRTPPPAPTYFEVNSTGAGIQLGWNYEVTDESKIDGFEIYRSAYLPDSAAIKIAEISSSDRDFIDNERTPLPAGAPIRGIDYYYYISAVGKADNTADNALTPTGVLRSSRYFTQTYDPARLLRPPGESMDEIRIVPNPYIASSSDALRFGRETRIAFFDVPGNCSIKVFTEIGEFVQEIPGTNSGDVYWDLMTKSRQRIASGVYIAIIENLDTGEKVTKKFVVIF